MCVMFLGKVVCCAHVRTNMRFSFEEGVTYAQDILLIKSWESPESSKVPFMNYSL